MSTMMRAGTALMPISVSYAGETIDMLIPQSVCLAEAIPGIVSTLGRLDPSSVSKGFEIVTSGGRKLDQSKPLPGQDVQAGALLALEPIRQSTKGLRYDDLVEVVGPNIDQDSKEWAPADSLQLSSHAVAALILVAALLFTLGPGHGCLSATIGIIGTPLVAAVSAIIVRIPSVVGAVLLLAIVPLLMMSAGFNLVGGDWRPITWLVGGIGILAAVTSALVLPSCMRATMVTPLVIGTTMVLNGVIGASTTIPLEKTASLTLALPLITSLSVSWLAPAQVPAKVTGPILMALIDTYEVHGKVSISQVFVVAIKAGVSISSGLLAPMLLNLPEAIILLGCSGATLMLTTRSLRLRLEVLIGVITEVLLILGAMFGAARSYPVMVPSTVTMTFTVATYLLAANVVSARTCPWLTRVANALSIAILLTILPLTTVVWGVV